MPATVTSRVILEEVSIPRRALRMRETYDEVPPQGYTFVPFGVQVLTDWSKERCRKQGRTVFYVLDMPKYGPSTDSTKLYNHVNKLGYHFPNDVVDLGMQFLNLSWENIQITYKDGARARLFDAFDQMAGEVALGHGDYIDLKQRLIQTLRTLYELYPKMPQENMVRILERATGDLGKTVLRDWDRPLATRVQLGVVAHIRHTFTGYDEALDNRRMTREQARDWIAPVVIGKLKEWAGRDDAAAEEEMEETFREVIVLDDADDDENEELEDGELRERGRDLQTTFDAARASHLAAIERRDAEAKTEHHARPRPMQYRHAAPQELEDGEIRRRENGFQATVDAVLATHQATIKPRGARRVHDHDRPRRMQDDRAFRDPQQYTRPFDQPTPGTMHHNQAFIQQPQQHMQASNPPTGRADGPGAALQHRTQLDPMRHNQPFGPPTGYAGSIGVAVQPHTLFGHQQHNTQLLSNAGSPEGRNIPLTIEPLGLAPPQGHTVDKAWVAFKGSDGRRYYQVPHDDPIEREPLAPLAGRFREIDGGSKTFFTVPGATFGDEGRAQTSAWPGSYHTPQLPPVLWLPQLRHSGLPPVPRLPFQPVPGIAPLPYPGMPFPVPPPGLLNNVALNGQAGTQAYAQPAAPSTMLNNVTANARAVVQASARSAAPSGTVDNVTTNQQAGAQVHALPAGKISFSFGGSAGTKRKRDEVDLR